MDFVRLKDCTKDVSGHLASLHISADLRVESEMKLLLARAGKSPSNFPGPTHDKDGKDSILTFHVTRDFGPTLKKEHPVNGYIALEHVLHLKSVISWNVVVR